MYNSSNRQTSDFLIIGAGIIGICIARELKKQHPKSRIIIIEKEKALGEHASGRNSGVLHAGFYYTKDSLKAKFTKLGNAALTQYCIEKGIPLNRCGKLVIARDESDLPGLHELLRRGQLNNISLSLITDKEAQELESRIKTYQQALWSPTTSSVNPLTVLQHMAEDAKTEGVDIHLNTQYVASTANNITTNRGSYSAGYIINSAGLYADKIARDFGFSKHYTILPFKGLYLYASNPIEKLQRHIYPVPNLQNPFLGVHFTVTHDGHVKIGPTAIPAFWREQYSGWHRFSLSEICDILSREITLFFKAGFNFKKLAWSEIKKYNRSMLATHAAELATNVEKHNYKTWGKPGIRAQLVNTSTHMLEMDFILEGDKNSFHILNAVSPAFTCSIPFSEYVVKSILNYN